MALAVKHATLNNGVVADDPTFPVGPDEWDEAHTLTGFGALAEANNAAGVPFTPAGNLAATDVQAALEELDSEKLPSSGGTLSSFVDFTEIADPANPAANNARVFARDNGAGKTQICVKFPTGSTIVIATED